MLFFFDNLEDSTYFGGKVTDVVYLAANHESELILEGVVKKKVLGVPTEYENDETSYMNIR